jgi:hypothetical protein
MSDEIAILTEFSDFTYGGPSFEPMFNDGMFRWRISAPVVIPASELPNISNTDFISSSRDRFAVMGDYQNLSAIIEDMRLNAGGFEPIGHWHIHNAGNNDKDVSHVEETSRHIVYSLSKEEFSTKYATLSLMLDPIVGRNGMQPVTEADLRSYERYLRAIDHCNLLEADLLAQARSGGWLLTDLGSIIDADLILGFALLPNQEKVRIVEIGGGYGRLAEVLVNVLGNNCHYVMVDSVPATMMFAYRYLRQALPNSKVGSFYEGDAYSADWTVYIMPSWQLEKLQSRSFNIAINIESFQEMSQYHVRTYLGHLTRLLGEGQLLYISNAWRYLYKDGFNIPTNFQTLMLQNTPRSWSAIHPTHILRKGRVDYSKSNAAILEHYRATCG